MGIEAMQDTVAHMRNCVHPKCVVCSSANETGLHLKFNVADDGSVTTTFQCNEAFEGYRGVLHGGVISSVLDGAMGNCMFARGQIGVTVEMTTRFRHPIATHQEASVSARIVRTSHPLYLLEAEITQGGVVKARATGKFIHKPELVQRTDGDCDE